MAQTKYIKSSRDNIEIALDERYSKNSSVCVILVHGMGEHKGRYKDFLEKIHGANISIVALDIRGHGESGGERGYIDDFNDFVADLGDVIFYVKNKYPHLKIALMGHSLGGLIATRYAEMKDDVDFPILSNPLVKYPVLTTIFRVIPYKLFGNTKIKKFKSESPEMLKYSYSGPLACNYFSLKLLGCIFTIGAPLTYENLEKVRMSVLLSCGEVDPILNPKRLDTVESRLGSKDKILKTYSGVRHRLLQSTRRNEVVEYIINWLRNHS